MYWRNQLIIAVNSLRKEPFFLLNTLVTLSISLSIFFAVASISNQYLFKSLPYKNAEQLLYVKHRLQTDNLDSDQFQMVKGLVHLYQEQNVFEQLSLMMAGDDLIDNLSGEPRLPIAYVTPEYFDLLSVPLVLGRGMTAQESITSKARVVLISEALWHEHFNGSSEVIGKHISLKDELFTIIGVVSANYLEPMSISSVSPQLWLPFDAGSHFDTPWDNTYGNLKALALLSDSVERSDAINVLNRLIYEVEDEWKGQWPQLNRISTELTAFTEAELGNAKKFSLILSAAAILLMFIALINVSNLFFSRIAAKERMLAIQAVVGAHAKHLFHAILVESCLITFTAIVLGLICSTVLVHLFSAYGQGYLPITGSFTVDWRILILSLAMGSAISYLFCYSVIRRLDMSKLNQYLKSGGKGVGRAVSRKTTRTLIFLQVCLASTIIVASFLILAKALESRLRPVGLDIANTYHVFSFIKEKGFTLNSKIDLQAQILTEFSTMEGVEKVSAGSAPIHGRRFASTFANTSGESLGFFQTNRVGKDYFELFDIEIVKGRDLSDMAYIGKAREILVTQSAAQQLAPGGEVIGKSFLGSDEQTYQVVGITRDVIDPKFYRQSKGVRIWMPQIPYVFPLKVKMRDGSTLTREQAFKLLKEISPNLHIWEFDSIEQNYNNSVMKESLTISLTIALLVLSLIFSCTGIYSLIHQGVYQRRFELGIRMACGAFTSRLIRTTVQDYLPTILLAIVSAVALMVSLVYANLSMLDTWVRLDLVGITLAVCLSFLIAMLACFIPARAIVSSNLMANIRLSS